MRIARFDQLDPHTLYRILRLREAVFAVEQQCIYTDLDGRDGEAAALHVWVDTDPAAPCVAACLRLLTEPDGSHKIGRIVTAPAERGRGLASALIDAALGLVGPDRVVALDAQVRLAPWYERWGFVRSGPDFDEDGIWHTPMRRLGALMVAIRPPAHPIGFHPPLVGQSPSLPAVETVRRWDPCFELGAATHRGRAHARNEDAVAVRYGHRAGLPYAVLVVCDGVTSSSRGDLAAAIAADAAADAIVGHLGSPAVPSTEPEAGRPAELGREVPGPSEPGPDLRNPAEPGPDLRNPSEPGPDLRNPAEPGQVLGTAADAEPGLDPDRRQHLLRTAVHLAHEAVCAATIEQLADRDPPGTTLVAALVHDGRVDVAWVGDSRAYLLSPARVDEPGEMCVLLTHDHSWINLVVDRGEMSEAEANSAPLAHAITRCIGPLHDPDPAHPADVSQSHSVATPGSRLVLCSDGVWGYAESPVEFCRLVGDTPPGASASDLAASLVARALERGGEDDMTVAATFVGWEGEAGRDDDAARGGLPR